MHYLWSDTETSGTNPAIHKVLTAYFTVYNEQLEFMDELELFVKPDDWETNPIIQDPGAFAVTGIVIEDHVNNPRTVTYSEAKKIILAFLTKYKIPNKRKHFRLSGHNVEFDKRFINAHLVEEEDWEKLVHYNTIDTLRICTFLQDMGYIAGDVGSLTSLVEYFGIPLGKAHDAKGDVKMNIEVYRNIKKMMADKKNNVSGISEHSLLSIVEL